jgi:hypothetical protein
VVCQERTGHGYDKRKCARSRIFTDAKQAAKRISQTNPSSPSPGMAQPSSWVDFLLRWVSERLPGRQR